MTGTFFAIRPCVSSTEVLGIVLIVEDVEDDRPAVDAAGAVDVGLDPFERLQFGLADERDIAGKRQDAVDLVGIHGHGGSGQREQGSGKNGGCKTFHARYSVNTAATGELFLRRRIC